MNEKKDGSGIYLDYYFKYDNKSATETYIYEIPFDVACEGIRVFFKAQNIKLEGADMDIWNTLARLGGANLFDVISDDNSFINFCKEKCKDDAFAEYKNEYEYENDLEEDVSGDDVTGDISKEDLKEIAQEAVDRVSQKLTGYDVTGVSYTHTSGPMADYGDTGEKDTVVHYTFDFDNAEIIIDENKDEEDYLDKPEGSITSVDININAFDENGNEDKENVLTVSTDIDWSHRQDKEKIIKNLVKDFIEEYHFSFDNL